MLLLRRFRAEGAGLQAAGREQRAPSSGFQDHIPWGFGKDLCEDSGERTVAPCKKNSPACSVAACHLQVAVGGPSSGLMASGIPHAMSMPVP